MHAALCSTKAFDIFRGNNKGILASNGLKDLMMKVQIYIPLRILRYCKIRLL